MKARWVTGIVAAATLLSGLDSRAQPEWRYAVRVAGMPVSDASGVQMESPFLGGFDVPRPQLVDINGDGKPELFVQERPGEIMYFERVGNAWQWRADRFHDLDVGEWYRFVDVDGDGDADLLAEMLTGYIRVWQNVGSRTVPKFAALGDTVRDVDGSAIAADRQNIINAVDIDCNGKLDLFVGRVQGVVDRFEQEGHSPDGSPRFRLLEPNWQGIEVIGPEVPGGATLRIDTTSASLGERPHGPHVSLNAVETTRRHGANTLTFADVSGRGVLDLYWGDFFEQGLLRFENTGSCAQPDLTGKPSRFPLEKPVLTSGYNAPAFGDVDGDGLTDLIVGAIGGAYGPFRTSVDNLLLVQQAPKGEWNIRTRRVIRTIDVGSESAPTLADLNGDGLLDLVIGSKIAPDDQATGTVTWFANVGTATEPAFREQGVLPVHGQFNYAPAVVDLDGDALPDLVLGTWTDRLQWYRNSGTRSAPAFTLADTALVTITRGSNTTPAFGDLDGDGLVDLIVGEASGTLNLYRNTGTKTSPRFTLVSDHFQDIKAGRRTAPALHDMDGDGQLDLLLGTDDGAIRLWRRTGGAMAQGASNGIRFELDSAFVLKSYPDAVPAVGALHGRGAPDILVGTLGGGLRWFSPVSR